MWHSTSSTWNFSDQRPYFKSDRCLYACKYDYNHKSNVGTGFLAPEAWVKRPRLTFYHKYQGCYLALRSCSLCSGNNLAFAHKKIQGCSGRTPESTKKLPIPTVEVSGTIQLDYSLNICILFHKFLAIYQSSNLVMHSRYDLL